MLEIAQETVRRSLAVKEAFAREGLGLVVRAAEIIANGFMQGKKLLVFGNGGSAADSQHLTGEMVNRFQFERPGLPAIALTTDTSILTAVGNDYSFDEVFAKQVKALGQTGDICLGISTSGRSANVLAGLQAAQGRNMVNIALTGSQAGALSPLCELVITVPSEETPRIQEVHGLVVHMLCELVDYKLFGRVK